MTVTFGGRSLMEATVVLGSLCPIVHHGDSRQALVP